MDDVLTPAQVVAITGLSRDKVYEMLRDGTLAGGRTSEGARAHWRIARSALDAWLGATRTPAGAWRSEDV